MISDTLKWIGITGQSKSISRFEMGQNWRWTRTDPKVSITESSSEFYYISDDYLQCNFFGFYKSQNEIFHFVSECCAMHCHVYKRTHNPLLGSEANSKAWHYLFTTSSRFCFCFDTKHFHFWFFSPKIGQFCCAKVVFVSHWPWLKISRPTCQFAACAT